MKRGKVFTFSSRPNLVRKFTPRHCAIDWDGSYGNGAGQASHCVGFVDCEVCGAKKGYLCLGPQGPKFSTHYLRRRAYTKMKREYFARQK